VHALARLANGGVAAPDDRERGQAAAQVDLHGDAARGKSVDREGGGAGKHRTARYGSKRDTTVQFVTIYACKSGISAERREPRGISAATAQIRYEAVLLRHMCSPSVALMSSDLRQQLGRLGEDLALEHLERLGFRRVARNYRTRFGELDLIVCDDDTIVFVEVKARRVSASAGTAVESVPQRKQRQVRGMAAAWLVESTDRPRSSDLRFDVVAVTVDDAGALVRLDHLEAAF